MKVKESTIRDCIAENLELLDPKLKLIACEHYIKMPDGKKAYIDILAKDDFGCFTVIELKKSNQTARSAIQQLLKYANFLKRKNRLEENQIRCMILSLVWEELEAPFSEFVQFSQYETKGYLVDYKEGKSPNFSQVKPDYEEGNCSPLSNFIFFEFSNPSKRDKLLDNFEATLKLMPSVNSVLIKMDYSGDDRIIVHPFGFAWIMFTGDINNMNLDISKLEARPPIKGGFDPEDIIMIWERELPEYLIRRKILLNYVRFKTRDGEYTGLSLHSLNNTLSTWKYTEPKGLGVMFDDALFDANELVQLSCGFAGDHHYNFIAKTTPDRPKQFQMIRKKLSKFLSSNKRWETAVNHILNEIGGSDIVDIWIFNPLNFFGTINDVYETGKSNRIPNLNIVVKKTNGTEIQFYGGLFWRERLPKICPQEAVKRSYGELQIFKLRSCFHSLNDKDVSLSELYGLTYELDSAKLLMPLKCCINRLTQWCRGV
jgi:Endonuclease NucS